MVWKKPFRSGHDWLIGLQGHDHKQIERRDDGRILPHRSLAYLKSDRGKGKASNNHAHLKAARIFK